jgi:hypothetical protein
MILEISKITGGQSLEDISYPHPDPSISIPMTEIGIWSDSQAISAKRSYLLLQRLTSLIGVSATLTAVLDFPGRKIVLAIQLVLMVTFTLRSIVTSAEGNWYALRALAESVKTLEWRVLMGLYDNDYQQANNRLKELADAFSNDLTPKLQIEMPSTAHGLIQQVNESQRISFEDKKRIYSSLRIRDQLDWYQRKARIHIKKWYRLKNLSTLALFSSLVLIIADLDFATYVPMLLAIAAFLSVENASAQNSSVASAYKVASEELQEILSAIDEIEENKWIDFVSDAEESISREHVSWRATRSPETRRAK